MMPLIHHTVFITMINDCPLQCIITGASGLVFEDGSATTASSNTTDYQLTIGDITSNSPRARAFFEVSVGNADPYVMPEH
jgi:hypothetical protein